MTSARYLHFLLLVVCVGLLPATVSARPGLVNQLYVAAQIQYARGDYSEAVDALEELVDIAPGVARYHHSLGKAYGRLAKESNFLKAMRLARKARASFERAVTLDSHSAKALADLIEYYEQAPGFLGGDSTKAKQTRIQLADVCATEPTDPGVCERFKL